MYAKDVQRILNELKFSYQSVCTPPNSEYLVSTDITMEDFIMYHQGYCLDLIHQLKDKICHLTGSILSFKNEYIPPKEKVLKKTLERSTNLGFSKLTKSLEEWNSDHTSSGLSVALKKRTFYHHFKNPLPFAEEFYKVKLHRILETSGTSAIISPTQKSTLEDTRNLHTEQWKITTAEKMYSTISKAIIITNEIAESLEKISGVYPSTHKKSTRNVLRYFANFASLEIKNLCDLSKINSSDTAKILTLSAFAKKIFGLNLVSFYVFGSVPRGESLVFGSDINMLILIESKNEAQFNRWNQGTKLLQRLKSKPIEVEILTKNEFYEDRRKKLRFIIKTDGLLIHGANLSTKENFPNPSYELGWLLNKDLPEKLVSLKVKILLYNEDERLIAISKLAKDTIRFVFMQEMGNHCYYSPNINTMIDIISFQTPHNKRIVKFLDLFRRKKVEPTDEMVIMFIEYVEKNILQLYKAVQDQVEVKNT